jgi:F-box-like
MPFDRLPNELFTAIFIHVNRRALLAASLVGKKYNALVVPLLWADADVRIGPTQTRANGAVTLLSFVRTMPSGLGGSPFVSAPFSVITGTTSWATDSG